MSNRASDHLFKLIKSLTKTEKRYFKVYQSRSSGDAKNNYIRLFDAIDKQSSYDEDQIRKKFKGESFVKSFPITKSRLYDSILRSLDSFHSNSSVDAQLKRNIHCAEILYKKSLYSQSAKLLKSSKRIAYKYEKHTTLLEILAWEKLLLEKDNYSGILEERLQEMLEEDRLILDKISNYCDFWNIKSRLFSILYKKGKVRSEDELENFKEIIDNVLLNSEDKALYFETKYLYHHIYSAYFFGIGDYPNSYEHLKQNIAYLEENIDKFKEEPNVYFSLLSNIIYVSSQLKMHDQTFLYLDKLRSLPETMLINSNEDLDIKLFSSVYSIELTILANTGQFSKGLELVPIVEEGLRLYGEKINNVRKAYLYYNIAILHFGEDDFSGALKWVNKLLNDVPIDKSEDIYCFTQILNLVIHIELGSNRLLPYALKSAQRYLSKRNRAYRFESVMLKFIGKYINAKSPSEIKELYTGLQKELEELGEDNFEKTAFEYFDFAAWAESHLSPKSFKEVMQEKAMA